MSLSRLTERAGTPPAVVWLAGALLGVGAFLFSLATLSLLNDHFGRISPARQIAVYGELPFRDFLDPGYFLTELSSAALQRLLGDNLLGEALLTSAFVAGGTVLVFLLARRLSQSVPMALAAAVVALLLLPRAYDYDKVLFYPLGILLCWRYVEKGTAASVWVLSAGLVAGALYRYDTGVYIAGAAVVAMAVVHAGEWKVLGRRLVLFGTAVAILLLPILAFLHYHGGVGDAVDQMVTYARRETARTSLSQAGFIVNADAFLYYLFRILPLAAAVALSLKLRSPDSLSRAELARLSSLIAVCLALNLFILRDPIGARFGGMAGPVAILSAWIGSCAWQVRPVVARRAVRAAVLMVLAATVWSVSLSADWQHRLTPALARPAHLVGVIRVFAATPPSLDAVANRQLMGMVKYVRECTSPEDRIMITWFAPELYFFAQRGFAGGMVAVFGDHWSEERFQVRSLRALAAQRVPLVILRTGDQRFLEIYPLLASYLSERYRRAGTTDFGDTDIGKDGYTVLVRRDLVPTYAHAATSLPCFW